MSCKWTDDKVLKHIEQWEEQGIQEQLEGTARNKHVYKKLPVVLPKAKSEKSRKQC